MVRRNLSPCERRIQSAFSSANLPESPPYCFEVKYSRDAKVSLVEKLFISLSLQFRLSFGCKKIRGVSRSLSMAFSRFLHFSEWSSESFPFPNIINFILKIGCFQECMKQAAAVIRVLCVYRYDHPILYRRTVGRRRQTKGSIYYSSKKAENVHCKLHHSEEEIISRGAGRVQFGRYYFWILLQYTYLLKVLLTSRGVKRVSVIVVIW